MLFKNLYAIGDRFEDKARAYLSHIPIIYAALGGAGIILFWRGIWHTVDYLVGYVFTIQTKTVHTSISELPWWDGPLSIALGSALLLSIGLFVTSFIGDAIIISGLKSDKKLTEKTEKEILAELQETDKIHAEIHAIHKRIRSFEQSMDILMQERQSERPPTTKKRNKRKQLPASDYSVK